MKSEVNAPSGEFAVRHLGINDDDAAAMLKVIGAKSISDLVAKTIPEKILASSPVTLPEPLSEDEVLIELKKRASKNKVWRSFIGLGYYGTCTPAVIRRNIFENPGWYTQYTPYQAEIAQGRLEALLNFQTMISDLTGLPVANASLLDEGTAAAEAMLMSYRLKGKEDRNCFLVSSECFPQTIEVLKTRAKTIGIELRVENEAGFNIDERVFGVLVQYPDQRGEVRDLTQVCEAAHKAGALAIAAADLLALALLKEPSFFGVDICAGNTQRFGVPLGCGGPHAAYIATLDQYKRQLPGRIIGVSKDSTGKRALRLSLQAREQHIRRGKATSNICTAQVLLAVMASMYGVYHGPTGIKRIAERVHLLTRVLASGLKQLGIKVVNKSFFDTIEVSAEGLLLSEISDRLNLARINLRRFDNGNFGISLDETASLKDVRDLLVCFFGAKSLPFSLEDLVCAEKKGGKAAFDESLVRTSSYLKDKVFNSYHSETEFLRYVKRLESRDLSLTTSMIPLGSCTMKLNAAVEMYPVSWPEFASIHPFAPAEQRAGYTELIKDLEKMLCSITGFEAVSFQPNAGSQGEYSGLLAIRGYHVSRGESNRTVCLIPESAHGTNPASAAMAGMKVVEVACDSEGNIDLEDLRSKAEEHKEVLAALMVTYPSTHGVFEEGIIEICDIIHAAGGQVYLDGANLNALVGICRPAEMGADVCHLNLHKTFCIPHGGGGPGVGPVAAKKHLVPFFPGHIDPGCGLKRKEGAVASAPFGSPSILPITWVYIRLMGAQGIRRATETAILSANYIAARLADYYPVYYTGKNSTVAHECILDLRALKVEAGIEVEDVAKRLMDYGFHAPTTSWPVIGTLMVEPTESESKYELDRFCDAMIGIYKEAKEIKEGKADKANNVLKNAPHTAEAVVSDSWDRPYSREQAAYPAEGLREHKFWPVVGRIDNVYGDRNLVCRC